MALWYYMKDGQQTGPVDEQGLRKLAASGGILPADLIWREGLQQWVNAEKVKGLFPAAAAAAVAAAAPAAGGSAAPQARPPGSGQVRMPPPSIAPAVPPVPAFSPAPAGPDMASGLDAIPPMMAARRRFPRWAIAVIAVLIFAFVGVPIFTTVHHAAQDRKCLGHLATIASALRNYADSHEGRLPASLEELCIANQLPSDLFVCPATLETPAPGPSAQDVAKQMPAGGHCSYCYLGEGLTKSTLRPDMVLVFENYANHRHINVVQGDFSVRTLAPGEDTKMNLPIYSGHWSYNEQHIESPYLSDAARKRKQHKP